MGQPLPIFVTERHPPWKLATSYLVAQGEFCCHPLLFYLDPYLLFPPQREGGETWACRSQDHLPCVGLRVCLVHVVGFLEHFGLGFVELWV